VAEVTARATADLMDLQVNTAALFYRKIRIVIAEKLETEVSEFAGEIELDESYFGGIRKCKRGRGAQGKVFRP
jgi:transposase